ncbi:MAG: hypothetical protein KC400_10050 [Methanolinea sp.]|nr:hypothetical protein [Methanolinea sp.]
MAAGEPRAVWLRVTGEAVGVVSLSASGKAVNVWIEQTKTPLKGMRVYLIL